MSENLILRDVTEADLPVFFEQQLDETGNYMAAFSDRDPADRDAFDAHWENILGDDTVRIKTIVKNGQVVGSVATFERSGEPEVTCWIGPQYWGQGIATQALAAFLKEVQVRPLYARAASDNIAALRVLQNCGFTESGRARAFANARGAEIEEVIFKLP